MGSSFLDMYEQQEEETQQRHQQETENPEMGRPERFTSIFLKDKIPEGVRIWRPKVNEEHIFNVLPWPAGSNHPFGLPKGKICWKIRYYKHTRLGAVGDSYVCPSWNFKQPCAVEEHLAKERLPKEEWSKAKAKDYCVYLVWVEDNEEERKKGVQIYDVASNFMEDPLEKISKGVRGGGAIPYMHPIMGRNIIFNMDGTKDQYKCTGHRFENRPAPPQGQKSWIPDWVWEQVFSLDEVIDWHPKYEEIYKSFHMTPLKTEATTTAPLPVKDDVPLNPTKTGSTRCIAEGGVFGNADAYPECSKCVIWEECTEVKKKNASAKKAPETIDAPADTPQPTRRRRA
jgi:hypothetical protein